MGTASGAFTTLFGIDFPKAIYEGNVLGLSARAPKSVYDGGLYIASAFLANRASVPCERVHG